MLALKLFSHPRKLLSVTGMNFMVYLTKFCLPFLSSWGRYVEITQGALGYIWGMWGFPGSSAGKESTCNAGDPDSIPELERSPGEGIDYPLHYFGASLVVQTVKNLPAMQETPVQFLGQEEPL